MDQRMNEPAGKTVEGGVMTWVRGFYVPIVVILLAGLLSGSCATGPRSGDSDVGSDLPSVRALRKESREVLGEFVKLPDGERQMQMIVFSYMLLAMYESGITVHQELWTELAEPVWPVILRIVEIEEGSSWSIITRGPAVKLTAPLEIEEAVPLLRRLAGSEDVYLARQAIDALGILGDQESIPMLREKLEIGMRSGEYGGGLDMTTSRYAALALWRLGDMRAAEILHANLDHPAQNVRTEAATAIAEMGDDAGIRALEARLQNPGAFRMDVIHALGRIDHPRAAELLEREMNLGDLRGRLLAARYLAAKGESAGRKYLLETVRTGELDFAYMAAMHLAAVRDREAVPILEQIFLNTEIDREKRLAAAAALAAMGNDGGYRDLVKSLRYDQWSQRAFAAAMLLIIPPPLEA